MKKLSYAEFQKRVDEVNRASKIFAPITNNVTEAFEFYQQILADDEEKMKVTVSTAEFGNGPMTPMDDFERPRCPECDTNLRLKVGKVLDGDGKEWPTAWVCEKCKAEFYSEKTAEEWMKELKPNVQEQ